MRPMTLISIVRPGLKSEQSTICSAYEWHTQYKRGSCAGTARGHRRRSETMARLCRKSLPSAPTRHTSRSAPSRVDRSRLSLPQATAPRSHRLAPGRNAVRPLNCDSKARCGEGPAATSALPGGRMGPYLSFAGARMHYLKFRPAQRHGAEPALSPDSSGQ